MKATIKKDFDYSADGIEIVRLIAGETYMIRPDLFPGLLAAGFIANEGERPAPAKKPVRAAPEAPVVAAGEPELPAPVIPNADPLDALEALEAGDSAEKPVVRHIGRGKYAIFNGDERLTADALTKDEAEAALAAMAGE
jgi:hypothetical protein